MIALKKREDIPAEYTWDLSTIFVHDEDWEQAFQSIQNWLPELEALKGTLAQSGQALLKVLQKRDEITEALECLFSYASMRKDEDTTNSIYQGMAESCYAAFCPYLDSSFLYRSGRSWLYLRER